MEGVSIRASYRLSAPLILALLVLASLCSFVFTGQASAVSRDPYNNPERTALGLCPNSPGDRRGAIWMSSASSTSSNANGYYNADVRVSATASSVTVYIRGSVYNCNSTLTGNTYARDVTPAGSNAYRLTNLSSTTLFRGRSEGSKQWSTKGDQIKASLNVSGLAPAKVGQTSSQTIAMDLWRCFSRYENSTSGTCYAETIRITVTRDPIPINWTASATSQVRQGSGSYENGRSSNPITVKPGSSVQFRHTIKNNGPTKTNAAVRGVTSNTGGRALNGLSSRVFLTNGSNSGVSETKATSSTSVTQDFVSDSAVYCQRVTASPGGGGTSSSDDKQSTPSCFKVPYNYTLTPGAPGDLPSSAEAGSAITNIRGDIYNGGPTKSRDDTIWQLTSFVRRSNSVRGSAASNGTAPCGIGESIARYNGQYYNTDGASSCRSLARGSGSINSGETKNVSIGNLRVPDNLDVGDSLCFAVSVRDRSSSPGSTPWRHSAPSCIIISKKPKVNILGGDLWVRGATATNSRVATSTTNNTEGVFGSFVEYALATRGRVTGMSSAAGYQGRSTANMLCGVSLLTFGNNGTSNDGCLNQEVGSYTRLPSTTPRLGDRFNSGFTGNMSGTVNLNGRNGTYSASGNVAINASTISKGRSVVIVAPNRDVTIRGDIEYDDGDLGSIDDIPQVVIIARNIFINAGVNRVDAWLVANSNDSAHGYVNTCGTGKVLGAGLDADACSEPLIVNGPVMADHLLMRRTAGAGPLMEAGDPAEVFNLRPDAYLWMANRISSGVGLPTTATRELPPKY